VQLVDRYNLVLRKHQLSNQQELADLQESYQGRFESTAELETEIAALSAQLEADHTTLLATATEFHRVRVTAAGKLQQHLQELMSDLKLPDARLQFELAQREELTDTGLTEVQLLFSANAGMEPKPVDKTASGGELSRLMLAVQATLSDTKSLPTLILDEIDTGVSGEVALRIGKLLQEMGQRMQLFAITHLPQVAAKGRQQYEVSKSSDMFGTNTTIRELTMEERLDAIARLMSGDSVSEASIANAQILLN
jgi:DNA repair protein RecN (Recombination protein N)